MPSITGIGLVTPLGGTAEETWSALLAGRFVSDHAKLSDQPDRLSTSAVSGAREAIAMARWTRPLLESDSTALIVGTSKGPIVDWIDASNAPPGRCEFPSDNSAVGRACAAFGLASLSERIAHDLKLGYGPRLILSAACASGLHAIIRAAMMIRSGQVKRALVVAAEASVHPLFVGSFQRLGVLAPPGSGCRPFDRDRAGFYMSEAAAAVCLEDRCDETGDQPLARIDRFAMGADAAHITAGDSSGRTLRPLIDRVLDERSVQLVHAHGTGTELNDALELRTIESAIAATRFADRPNLYSHKGSLGHSLGAAGLVSVVLSAMMHRAGVVLPNVRTEHPIPASHLRIDRQSIPRRLTRSLTLATGFGGPAAAVGLISI